MPRLRDALCLRLHLGDYGVTTVAWAGTRVGIGRLRWLSLGWGGTVTLWTGHVEDDGGVLAIFFFGDGGEGAEELVGDVGEDGGAAGGDFVLGEEEEQAREEVVDLGGGGEVVEVGGESGGDFGGFRLILWQAAVGRAEMGIRGRGRETAAPAVGIEKDA